MKALHLPEEQSAAVSYSKTEMRVFLTQIGYTGDMRRMGRLVRTKLRKEWNFYFDCIGRCFTNKCSNFDALNHLVQHIGYSLLHNVNFDIASIILEYPGLRISEGKNVYFDRFIDLVFKYSCPDIVFENDSYLLVFQLNSRVFRDMIGTDNKFSRRSTCLFSFTGQASFARNIAYCIWFYTKSCDSGKCRRDPT